MMKYKNKNCIKIIILHLKLYKKKKELTIILIIVKKIMNNFNQSK